MNPYDWQRTVAAVEEVSLRAKRMYLGRTSFPERRLLEHRRDKGLNKMFALFWSADQSEIRRAESSLLKQFGALEHVENAVGDSRGRWGRGPSAVYVAWTWSGSGGDGLLTGLSAKLVNELPDEPGRSRYLQTELTIAQATRLLG